MNRIAGRRYLSLALLLWSGWLLAGAAVAGTAPETVCIQCHGGQTGRLQKPVEQWRASIHSRNGISCHNCHGGDPTDFGMAMSPERGFVGAPEKTAIPDFCGRCHVGVKADYQQSAHGRALGSGGPQCVTCHGNHAVTEASLDLINSEACSRCHEYGRAKVLREALGKTDGMISGLEDDFRKLRRVGIDVKELSDRTFALRNQFHRLFHSVDVEQVRSRSAGFQGDLEKVGAEVDSIRATLQQRKATGGIVVGLLVVMGILAMLIRKIYADEESAGPSSRNG